MEDIVKLIKTLDKTENGNYKKVRFSDMGAYTAACRSEFNGFNVTKIVYVISMKNL